MVGEKFKVRCRFSQKSEILGSVPVAELPQTLNFYISGEILTQDGVKTSYISTNASGKQSRKPEVMQ